MAMTYEDKLEIYKEEFEVDGFRSYPDQVKLISLTVLLTRAARVKDAKIQPMDILMKMNNDMKCFGRLYQGINYQCYNILKDSVAVDGYGLTKASDMATEIRRILETWLPF